MAKLSRSCYSTESRFFQVSFFYIDVNISGPRPREEKSGRAHFFISRFYEAGSPKESAMLVIRLASLVCVYGLPAIFPRGGDLLRVVLESGGSWEMTDWELSAAHRWMEDDLL